MERFYSWRAAVRLARRDAWRNKGRSALIALMVALPVLTMSALSVVYRSDERDPQDDVRVSLGRQAPAEISYGDGNSINQSPDNRSSAGTVSSNGEAARITMAQFEDRVARVISTRDRIVPDHRIESFRNLRWGGRFISAAIREFDYDTAGLSGIIEQVSGRPPAAAGEVVVSGELADDGVAVGDSLGYRPSTDGPELTLTVVGVVDGLSLDDTRQVIGRSGTIFPATAFSGRSIDTAGAGQWSEARLLVVGPDPVTWDQVLDLNQLGASVLSREVVANPPPSDRVTARDDINYYPRPDADSVGIAAVVIGLVLLQIALLAGPAIAVGARRNQRTLALLASAGAERKHLRAVVLATNGVIGLVSCAVAAGAGVLAGIVIVQVLRAYDITVVRIDVHPLDLAVLVAVGAFTSVAASLLPARQAARLDVVAALTGRRGYSPPALRVPVTGLVLALLGAALAVVSSGRRWAFPTVLGLALTEIGLVMAAGAVVALAARLAVRLPFSARFALRDAARQRTRTAPAVAAVLAAIAGGSTALVYIAAQDDHDRQEYRPAAAAGVVTVGLGYFESPMAEPSLPKAEALLRRELPIDTVQRFQVIGSTPERDYYLEAKLPTGTVCPGVDPVITNEAGPCQGRTDPDTIDFPTGQLFDDGTALNVLTGGAATGSAQALAAGKVVTSDPELIWPGGTVHVSVESWNSDDTEEPTREVALPAVVTPPGDRRLSTLVYPLTAAKALGVTLEDGGLVAGTTRMPGKGDVKDADKLLQQEAGYSLDLERGYESAYALGLIAMLVAATLISLLGTFTAVGLAAAEGRADVATLAAVGASPGVRRRLAAAQSGVISGLGGLLGVASGILGGWVLIRMQQDGDADFGAENLWHLVIPWWYLLAVGLGIPLVAMAIGFLTTRSRLPVVRRLGQ